MEVIEGETKRCSKCGTSFPLFFFNNSGKSKDGRHSWCKPCQRVYDRRRYETHRGTEKEAPTEKRCPRCDNTKQLYEFHPNKGRKDGRNGWCKLCEADARLKRATASYGISYERYCETFAEQRGRCRICEQRPVNRRLAIDHDHSCCPVLPACGSCFRGLLCSDCNTSLGKFEDSIPRLKAAIAYLEEHQAKNDNDFSRA